MNYIEGCRSDVTGDRWPLLTILARQMGQYCCACWCLLSVGVVVCNAAGRRAVGMPCGLTLNFAMHLVITVSATETYLLLLTIYGQL